jgi:ribonucleotide monophosphatase NagD (HAD superfamily)
MSTSVRKIPAIAFDATGVIYRGSRPLPYAKEAFEKLIRHKVPYCVLTNAGSSLEIERAMRFNDLLGIPDCFGERNLIQANTPMRNIIHKAIQNS